VRAIRAVLGRVEALTIPSQAASPNIRVHLRSVTPSASASAKPATPAPCNGPLFDIAGEDRLLHGIVTRHSRRACGSLAHAFVELVETRPSICRDRDHISKVLYRRDRTQVLVVHVPEFKWIFFYSSDIQ